MRRLQTTLQEAVDSLTDEVADSVDQAADSTAGDTVAVADTASDAISTIGREVSDAGRRLAEGDVPGFFDQVVQGVAGWASDIAPQMAEALFVGLVFYVLYRIVFGTVQRLLRRGGRVDSGMTALLLRTIRAIGLAFVVVLALSQLGLNVSALLAGLGIAGLAVGFAAKDSLENFIAGVSILMDRPFRVGHWVKVGDNYGQVTELTLRSTRLRTLNREEVVIPNVQMITQPLTNQSSVGRLRVDVEFSVAYKEDIDETRRVVLGLVGDDDRLADEPEPAVVVTKLGESSVDMELHLFLKDASKAVPVRFEYTEAVRKALAAADIEIPFPHLQLFIDEARGLERLQGVGWAPRDEDAAGE